MSWKTGAYLTYLIMCPSLSVRSGYCGTGWSSNCREGTERDEGNTERLCPCRVRAHERHSKRGEYSEKEDETIIKLLALESSSADLG